MIEKGKLYFIAEIGQNHQGDINVAKKMVSYLEI
jgi:sialic acid synthase SpsE